ncbi:MAG: DoxX family membrane protein [Bacteroidetes bacterium]|nr:MAG: DoxX family membrane protein [Bacteroidota bacterium]
MKDIADLIGRICLSFIFLYEAADSIIYFKSTKLEMETYGLIWNTEFLLVLGIVLLILGGLLLLTGYRSGLGVTLLLLYWVPTTFVVHDFWNVAPDCLYTVDCLGASDEFRRLKGILFMKNIAVAGGLLMVWVNGSGRYSIRRLFATTRVPKKWGR